MPLFFYSLSHFSNSLQHWDVVSDRSEELAIASLLTILRNVDHNALAKDAAVPGCAVVPGLAILYQAKTSKETCETGKWRSKPFPTMLESSTLKLPKEN
jgi:hypothetical protein